MNPATTNTELQPSTQLRKAACGGSLKHLVMDVTEQVCNNTT
jgi:hypothetical protein